MQTETYGTRQGHNWRQIDTNETQKTHTNSSGTVQGSVWVSVSEVKDLHVTQKVGCKVLDRLSEHQLHSKACVSQVVTVDAAVWHFVLIISRTDCMLLYTHTCICRTTSSSTLWSCRLRHRLSLVGGLLR